VFVCTQEKEIEMVLYVDQTVVEAYFQGGRMAFTDHVPTSLLLPHGGNKVQGVEIFATDAGVTVLNATVWRMGDIWDAPTHGRTNHKP
jgi:hypothetical protein